MQRRITLEAFVDFKKEKMKLSGFGPRMSGQ